MEQIKQRLNLSNFYGTENYYKGYLNVTLTDGVYFVMLNKASWLITDICSVVKIHRKVRDEEFVSITFKVNTDNTAEVIYTDGNNNVLYKQEYKYTDFLKHFEEIEVKFFYTNDVLMLSGEY